MTSLITGIIMPIKGASAPIKSYNSPMAQLSFSEWINLGLLATTLSPIVFWGGKISGRVTALEEKTKIIEDHQIRIENKIDALSATTSARIDDCKNSILNAILESRK